MGICVAGVDIFVLLLTKLTHFRTPAAVTALPPLLISLTY